MTSTSQRVHELYHGRNWNCAGTMLACLGEAFDTPVSSQPLHTVLRMHGAGGFPGPCGLVEGALIFIGIAGTARGLSDNEVESMSFRFAEAFRTRFGSLLCQELRPGGLSRPGPPHVCESLTVEAVDFTVNFMQNDLFAQAEA